MITRASDKKFVLLIGEMILVQHSKVLPSILGKTLHKVPTPRDRSMIMLYAGLLVWHILTSLKIDALESSRYPEVAEAHMETTGTWEMKVKHKFLLALRIKEGYSEDI